ncbi:hypothetical protein BDP81DRAFT_69856 [Colletotrichum phormii]|uniref:Uncharacterized protein n=1 Tax=Colletotrichum phormii TaxID=359342 RepID=A0AAI9ZKJ7_9PEZI|nr:uncharacterized protein BDP81DRAFT_69856 [Colletotrichum phormii]KAK1633691.1 hypothetical protein BDP81DRAFT_69856 [Colletotrichum phormii]
MPCERTCLMYLPHLTMPSFSYPHTYLTPTHLISSSSTSLKIFQQHQRTEKKHIQLDYPSKCDEWQTPSVIDPRHSMASNSRSGIEANTKNDQERFDGTLAPRRKNRKLLMVKGLPFAETRNQVEAFLKSKLNKPDSANFHWPPSKDPRQSLPSSHHG